VPFVNAGFREKGGNFFIVGRLRRIRKATPRKLSGGGKIEVGREVVRVPRRVAEVRAIAWNGRSRSVHDLALVVGCRGR